MSTFNTDGLIIDLDEAPAATPPPIPGNQQQQQKPPPTPSLPEKKEASVEDEAVDRLRKQMEAKLAAKEEETRLLREQMAAERASRLKAEGQARDAGFEKEWSDYTAATAAFDGAKNRIASLKSQWKAAHEAGDLDKAAEAQAQLGVESARMVQFEIAKDQLHDRLEARKNQPAPKQEEPAVPAITDPVEQFVTHNKLTTKAAQWFRDHPEFVKDQEKNHLVIAADTAARRDGLKRDSDEYFEYINDYVGLGEGENKSAPKRGKSVPAAPVNGSGRGSQFTSSNMDGNRVRMSPRLRETAEAMFPKDSPADAHKRYAKNAIALIKDGKLPKDFFDTH